MNWVAVLWAVICGVAAGISADWDEFCARERGKRAKSPPHAEQQGKEPAAAGAQAKPQGAPAAQVHVDVKPQGAEFASGVPFMGGPRVQPPQPEMARRDGESRRKRRSQPAAPTPGEQVCARCKAAIEREMTTEAGDLAVAQEAEREVSTAEPAVKGVPPQPAASPDTSPASSGENPSRRRGSLAGRLVTRLGTRGALSLLADPGGSPTAAAGAAPAG